MMSNVVVDGIHENNKPSSKVLRPPGGGTSDIFGTDMPQTPRSVKNHMQSNIFSCEKNASAIKNNGDQPRRAQKNVDSYSRLFGEPDRPITPAKNFQKSSIPFGAKSEAAQQLLSNGNGHHHNNHQNHHSNGKSGSVSSASSSVSSSTENLKINGLSKTEIDEACPLTPTPPSSEVHSSNTDPIEADASCEDTRSSLSSARSKLSDKADLGAGDIGSQTRRDSGNNPENPYSLSKMSPPSEKKEPLLSECLEKFPRNVAPPSRNPITGLGLGEDGVGGIKPKKPKTRRDGNPVTGEGYKGGHELNNSSVPSLNGANQVINKNRIPPGGFSSGLW